MSQPPILGEDGRPWRPSPLLPRGDGRDRALVFVVATLCFLACLTVLVALAGDRAAQGWRGDLAASATVQVRPKGDESPSEAAARAAEALAAVKGVTEARVLDRAVAQRLLEPWLGKGNIPEDLPLPLLVTLDLDPAAPASPAAMNAALQQAGVDAELDDHSRWMKEVERAGFVVRAAALAACALTALAAAAVIAFATRAGLAARRDVVEVLHLTGARDGFVAGLFQRRFAALAARAGTYGTLAAAVMAALARAFGGVEGFTPVLPLAWADILACIPCPLLAAAVAAVSARRTALSILRAEP
ncbi:MAG TPA: FtsX-like permease family protein [Caulobacteraceae bacterium]|jgi:cell division transport system permease protein|nr:FtsX-like permease family protein [Caulobacteraceae bacterium]